MHEPWHESHRESLNPEIRGLRAEDVVLCAVCKAHWGMMFGDFLSVYIKLTWLDYRLCLKQSLPGESFIKVQPGQIFLPHVMKVHMPLLQDPWAAPNCSFFCEFIFLLFKSFFRTWEIFHLFSYSCTSHRVPIFLSTLFISAQVNETFEPSPSLFCTVHINKQYTIHKVLIFI